MPLWNKQGRRAGGREEEGDYRRWEKVVGIVGGRREQGVVL